MTPRPYQAEAGWGLYVQDLPPGRVTDLVRRITASLAEHRSPTSGGPTPQDTFLLEWEHGHRHFEIEIVARSGHVFECEWYYFEPENEPGSGGAGTMAQAVEAAGRYLPQLDREDAT